MSCGSRLRDLLRILGTGVGYPARHPLSHRTPLALILVSPPLLRPLSKSSQLSPESSVVQTLPPAPTSTGSALSASTFRQFVQVNQPKVLWRKYVSPLILSSTAFSGNIMFLSSMMSHNGGREEAEEGGPRNWLVP